MYLGTSCFISIMFIDNLYLFIFFRFSSIHLHTWFVPLAKRDGLLHLAYIQITKRVPAYHGRTEILLLFTIRMGLHFDNGWYDTLCSSHIGRTSQQHQQKLFIASVIGYVNRRSNRYKLNRMYLLLSLIRRNYYIYCFKTEIVTKRNNQCSTIIFTTVPTSRRFNDFLAGWLGIAVIFVPVMCTILVNLLFCFSTKTAIKRMSTYGQIHHKMKYR